MINNNDVKKEKSLCFLTVYILIFFIVWVYYSLYFTNDLSSKFVLNIVIVNSIKYIVWTIPVFIILSYIYRVSPITYLKLNNNITRGLIYGVIFGFLIVLYHVIRNYIMGDGKFDFNIDLYTWIHRIILIGLTEEVVFRGFILQKLQEEIRFRYANAISSILFVLIHFPKWYESGMMSHEKIIFFMLSIVFTFAFGLFQGYILKRSNSLWACMIIHSFNNLITTIIKV